MPMPRKLRAPALLALAALAGCRTEVQQQHPASVTAPDPALARPSAAWELVHDGRVVGVVVEFVEGATGRRFFSVRNAAQQELGMVDQDARAWRYRPHEEEAEWLGTGTVLEGAARILSLEGAAEAYEVPLDTLTREAHTPPHR